MDPLPLTGAVVTFGMTLWLGLYLIGRAPRRLMLWLSGISLIAMALSLMLFVLDQYAPTIDLALVIIWEQRALTLLALLAWFGCLIALTPSERQWQMRMRRNRRLMLLILAGTITLSMGIALLQLSRLGLPRGGVLHAIALNLLVVGTAVAGIEAADQGEAFWPHYLRAFDYAFFTALLFGGQIALAMWLATGVNFVMLAMLYGVIGTAVAVQTFSQRVTNWADNFAFFAFPAVREARRTLRDGAEAATRVDAQSDPLAFDQESFERLTRQALSQMPNLPKLATNPLTRLPLVSARLSQDGVQIDTLSRAKTLRQLLTESILRLKPATPHTEPAPDFAATDAWRHFNALYFPYVVGLRPYRRIAQTAPLDDASRRALEWFRRDVPPRTLYNWQTDASRLIARDLRERSRGLLHASHFMANSPES